jgi:hypothetical protein
VIANVIVMVVVVWCGVAWCRWALYSSSILIVYDAETLLSRNVQSPHTYDVRHYTCTITFPFVDVV